MRHFTSGEEALTLVKAAYEIGVNKPISNLSKVIEAIVPISKEYADAVVPSFVVPANFYLKEFPGYHVQSVIAVEARVMSEVKTLRVFSQIDQSRYSEIASEFFRLQSTVDDKIVMRVPPQVYPDATELVSLLSRIARVHYASSELTERQKLKMTFLSRVLFTGPFDAYRVPPTVMALRESVDTPSDSSIVSDLGYLLSRNITLSEIAPGETLSAVMRNPTRFADIYNGIG